MAKGPAGPRLIIRHVAVVASQLVNLSIVVGGIYLAIVVSADLAQRIATYEAMFGHADNDVIRGPTIVIVSAGLAAVLALVTFLLLIYGHRWACWIDCLNWILIWPAAAINSHSYFGDTGYTITNTICISGISLAVVTFIAMSYRISTQTRDKAHWSGY